MRTLDFTPEPKQGPVGGSGVSSPLDRIIVVVDWSRSK